jgi:hypothetical protein
VSKSLSSVVLAAALLLTAACDSTSPTAAPNTTTGPRAIGGISTGSSSIAVLANAAVTCTGGIITGSVGTFQAAPAGSVTQTGCAVTGDLNLGDEIAQQSYSDFLNTYAALAPQTDDVCTNLTGTVAGVTLAPGLYCFGGAATVTGILTLDGPADGVWTFKVGTGGTGAITGTGFQVVLANGAQASNVTWRVSDAATFTSSDFQGNLLTGAAITMTGGSFHGTMRAQADVTITGTTIN